MFYAQMLFAVSVRLDLLTLTQSAGKSTRMLRQKSKEKGSDRERERKTEREREGGGGGGEREVKEVEDYILTSQGVLCKNLGRKAVSALAEQRLGEEQSLQSNVNKFCSCLFGVWVP